MLTGNIKKAVVGEISRRFPKIWLERELRHRPNHFEQNSGSFPSCAISAKSQSMSEQTWDPTAAT